MTAPQPIATPEMAGADALRQRLGFRRSREHVIGGTTVLLVELSALDAGAIWGELADAEHAGRMLDAYVRLVLVGVCSPAGERLFATLDEVEALPARVVTELAEIIMELTDLGVDSGKVEGDPAAI